jgi:hypothetical protein
MDASYVDASQRLERFHLVYTFPSEFRCGQTRIDSFFLIFVQSIGRRSFDIQPTSLESSSKLTEQNEKEAMATYQKD